jgi:hypothetical protein
LLDSNSYVEEPPKVISDWASHYLAPPVPEEQRVIANVPTKIELQIRLDISDEAALQRALGRMRDPLTVYASTLKKNARTSPMMLGFMLHKQSVMLLDPRRNMSHRLICCARGRCTIWNLIRHQLAMM